MLVVINKDSLMRSGVCGKLHGGRSQLLFSQSHSTSHRSDRYSSRIAIFAELICIKRPVGRGGDPVGILP